MVTAAVDSGGCRYEEDEHEGHVIFRTFEAEWDTYGRAAGAIRNTRMLAEGKPTLVVAFPGGKGTSDMVRQSEKAGIKVLKIEW